MRLVKIAELKDRLSEHLRAAEAGEEVVVTDRNRPIVRIVAVQATEPVLTLEEPTTSFKIVRVRKYPPAHWRLTGTQLLAAERKES